MTRQQKAGACDRSGSKTDFTGGEIYSFSASDLTTEIESITPIIEGMMATGKTIRCYRCFSCNRHFAAARMSTALVVCRNCFRVVADKGRKARQNSIDRLTNNLKVFLRGRMEAR